MGYSGLVERDSEQRAIVAALESARAGQGTALLITGAAGIGKTELLRWARREAARRQMTVLAARASPVETPDPFSVARRLLSAGGRSPAPEGGFDGRSTQATTATDLVTRTLELASRSPSGLLVAVDDLHACDRESLRFLTLLVDSVDSARTTVLLTLGARRSGVPDDLVSALVGTDTVSVLRPSALTRDGVLRLVVAEAGDTLDAPAAAELARACFDATVGNPFLLRELIDVLDPSQAVESDDLVEAVRSTVPATVVRAVAGRLSAFGDGAHQLARAVAILGPGAGIGEASELAGLPLAASATLSELFVDAGLLKDELPLSFSQPLVAAAVLADLNSLALANQHRRAATILRAHGATPSRVGAHLLRSAPAADPDAVGILQQAAAEAARHGSPGQALALLRRALLEPPAPDQRGAVVLELARAEAEAGEPSASDRFLQALDLADHRHERVVALRELSRLQFIGERHPDAAATIQRAMVEVGPDSPVAADLLAEYIAAVSFGAAVVDPPTRAEFDARVRALFAQHLDGTLPDHPALTLQVASILAGSRGRRSDVESLLVQTLAHGPLDELPPFGFASTWAVLTLLSVDAVGLAVQVGEDAYRAALQHGSLLRLGNAAFSVAASVAGAGQLARAEQECSKSLRLAQSGVTSTLVWSAALLATVRRERGDLLGARRALATAEHTDRSGMSYGILLHHSSLLSLAEGDAARAGSEARSARAHLEPFHLVNYPLAPWRLVAGLAADAEGRPDEAADLIHQELALARRADAPASISQALQCLARISDPSERVPLLDESVSVLGDSGAVLQLAHATSELGLAHLGRSDSDMARQLLLDGYDLARGCGASPLARRVRAALRALGTRPRPASTTGGTALTEAERRTAQLASHGLSNREIADKLHLTTSTVEFHLTRAYRKLGIRSREQLKGLSL